MTMDAKQLLAGVSQHDRDYRDDQPARAETYRLMAAERTIHVAMQRAEWLGRWTSDACPYRDGDPLQVAWARGRRAQGGRGT